MMFHRCEKWCAGAALRASFILLSALALCFCGCRPENKELALKLSWRAPLFENPRETAESIYPIQAGDQIIAAKLSDNAAPVFYALDARRGDVRRQTVDSDCAGNLYYNMKPFCSKQGVVIPCGSTLKCMYHKTGKIPWSFQHAGTPEQFLEPYTDDTFLQAVNDWEERKSHIYKVNANDGKAHLLHSIQWPDSSKLLIKTPVKVKGDYLLFTSIAMRYGTNETEARWHLLDLKNAGIMASSTAYPANKDGYGVTKQAVTLGDQAFMVAYDHVFCVSSTAGKELWRTALPRDMLTSVPVASYDGLYCPMEDGYLYKLSPDDGRVIWKTKIAATPSRPVITNGLLFIVGGSDGVLYVINTQDGELIKTMKAPNHDFIRNQFFRRYIGVDAREEKLMLFDGNSFRGYQIWR